MFIPAAIASSIILILALLAIARGGGWIAAYFFVGGFLAFGSIGAMVILFPPPLFFAFLGIGVAFRSWLQTWPRRFASVGAACFATSAIIAWEVRNDFDRLAKLRDERPLVPLATRLPSRSLSSESKPLPEETNLRLTAVETKMASEESLRRHALKSLHENTTSHFVSSPGFGVTRMSPYRPNARNVKSDREREEVKPPPAQPHRRDFSADEGESRPEPLRAAAELERLHQDSTLDFVNPEGFGYVTETRQVAGFEPHHFASPPKPAGEWNVATVDLVGLLLSETPRVYESKNLPRMDELKNAATRPLDRFESEGLAKNRNGEDLIVASTASGVRMLGAIRSAKQCLQCHQGNRGDLLGAFTYRLERKGKD